MQLIKKKAYQRQNILLRKFEFGRALDWDEELTKDKFISLLYSTGRGNIIGLMQTIALIHLPQFNTTIISEEFLSNIQWKFARKP